MFLSKIFNKKTLTAVEKAADIAAPLVTILNPAAGAVMMRVLVKMHEADDMFGDDETKGPDKLQHASAGFTSSLTDVYAFLGKPIPEATKALIPEAISAQKKMLNLIQQIQDDLGVQQVS